jgi:hypothetical protein
MVKVYSLSIRNRAAATLLGVAVLALGAVFLTLGFALLLGLVIAGGVIGAGVAGYRLLRGGAGRGAPRATASVNFDQYGANSRLDAGLDPALEVKPVAKAIVRPREEND